MSGLECGKMGARLKRAHPQGMSDYLLVKLAYYADIFPVHTHYDTPFEAWKDKDGVDLYWMGRRVEHIYSMCDSGERYWSVPIPFAVKSLVKRKLAKIVKSEPTVKGKVPS